MKYASLIFILCLNLSAFGGVKVFADFNNQRAARKVRLNSRDRRSENLINRRQIRDADFPAENFASALFSVRLASPAEVLAAGELDNGFGGGGKTTTPFGDASAGAEAAARQPDEKFVLAGSVSGVSGIDFALARYNADGSPDTSFGSGGKVVTDIGGTDNAAFALVIQPADGKLIAAGNRFNGRNDDFALVRYNPDGTLDGTFGTGGIVTTNFNNSFDYIDAAALQADGKIVAAGYSFDGSNFQFALARYNSDGTLDATFGTGGQVTTRFTQFDDLARAVVIQPDGKIVVAGEADTDFAVARYNSDGSLDAAFDGDGRARTSLVMFDAAYDVALQLDGKIVVAGEAGNGSDADFGLARYNADGSLDLTFDADGKVTTPIGGSNEIAQSLALQSDGKILVGGFSFNGSNDDFALARYNADGSPDSSFGNGGKTTTNFSKASNDYAAAVLIQSNNRVIAAGGSGSNFAAAAYYLQTITCSATFSPTSINLSAAAGAGSFSVTTQTGCSRTATSNNSWITITGGNGTGSGTVNFSTEANSGAARTGTISVGGQNLTVNQAAASAFEADVFPRGTGDGVVSSTDVSIIQGFQLGFGTPYQNGEFQRADCAPFGTRGDGRVTSIDVAQAQAYQLGFNLAPGNTLQPAAGPTAPVSGLAAPQSEQPGEQVFFNQSNGVTVRSGDTHSGVRSARRVRVAEAIVSPDGQSVVVPIEVDAAGDESVYGFSLSYDSSKLANPVVSDGATGGAIALNTTRAGSIGVSVSFGGKTIAAGRHQQLIRVRFSILAGASTEATAITLNDSLSRREVASGWTDRNGVEILPTMFIDGRLPIVTRHIDFRLSRTARLFNVGDAETKIERRTSQIHQRTSRTARKFADARRSARIRFAPTANLTSSNDAVA